MHGCVQSQNEGTPPGLAKLETSQEVQKLLPTYIYSAFSKKKVLTTANKWSAGVWCRSPLLFQHTHTQFILNRWLGGAGGDVVLRVWGQELRVYVHEIWNVITATDLYASQAKNVYHHIRTASAMPRATVPVWVVHQVQNSPCELTYLKFLSECVRAIYLAGSLRLR